MLIRPRARITVDDCSGGPGAASSGAPPLPIVNAMHRSVIGLCACVGATVASLAPELWGGSAFSLASLAFGTLGGFGGVWFGARISGL